MHRVHRAATASSVQYRAPVPLDHSHPDKHTSPNKVLCREQWSTCHPHFLVCFYIPISVFRFIRCQITMAVAMINSNRITDIITADRHDN